MFTTKSLNINQNKHNKLFVYRKLQVLKNENQFFYWSILNNNNKWKKMNKFRKRFCKINLKTDVNTVNDSNTFNVLVLFSFLEHFWLTNYIYKMFSTRVRPVYIPQNRLHICFVFVSSAVFYLNKFSVSKYKLSFLSN